MDEIVSVISASYSVPGLHFPATVPESMIRKPTCDIIMIAPDLSSCTQTKLTLLRMSQYFPLLSWATCNWLQFISANGVTEEMSSTTWQSVSLETRCPRAIGSDSILQADLGNCFLWVAMLFLYRFL